MSKKTLHNPSGRPANFQEAPKKEIVKFPPIIQTRTIFEAALIAAHAEKQSKMAKSVNC